MKKARCLNEYVKNETFLHGSIKLWKNLGNEITTPNNEVNSKTIMTQFEARLKHRLFPMHHN